MNAEQKKSSELPEVFALKQDNQGWQSSRRDFLAAAGLVMVALPPDVLRAIKRLSKQLPLSLIC